MPLLKQRAEPVSFSPHPHLRSRLTLRVKQSAVKQPQPGKKGENTCLCRKTTRRPSHWGNRVYWGTGAIEMYSSTATVTMLWRWCCCCCGCVETKWNSCHGGGSGGDNPCLLCRDAGKAARPLSERLEGWRTDWCGEYRERVKRGGGNVLRRVRDWRLAGGCRGRR